MTVFVVFPCFLSIAKKQKWILRVYTVLKTKLGRGYRLLVCVFVRQFCTGMGLLGSDVFVSLGVIFHTCSDIGLLFLVCYPSSLVEQTEYGYGESHIFLRAGYPSSAG